MGRNLFEQQQQEPQAGRNLLAQQPQAQTEQPTQQRGLSPEVMSEVNEPTLAERVTNAVAEPIQAILGSLVGTSASGIAAIPDLLEGDVEKAGARAKSIQQSFAESAAPKTEEGKAVLETLGDITQYGSELANIPLSYVGGFADYVSTLDPESAKQTIDKIQSEGFFNVLGEKVEEETGSRLMGVLAQQSPEIIGTLIPLKGIRSNRVAKNRELMKRVESTDADKELFKYQVIEQPKDQIRAELGLPKTGPLRPEESQKIIDLANQTKTLKTNHAAVESAKQGFDEGVLRAINTVGPENKKKLLRMVDTLEKGKKNKLYQVKNRPADIVGESVKDRLAFLKEKASKHGKDVEKQALELKGRKVDFGGAVDNFMAKLADEGVTINPDFTPNFVGSTFDGAKGAEAIITRTLKRMEKTGDLDAYDIHRMKKTIDEWIYQGKQSEGGLSKRAENIIKGFRHDLDNALDTNFPLYDKANTAFKQAIEPINQINDSLKIKIPFESPNYVGAIGQELRKVMSNYKSRNELLDSMELLDSAVAKFGGNFGDDLMVQALFANELDAVFGPVARTSLAGTMAQEIKRGARMATDTKGAAIDMASELVDKARGINEENALKAIREFLKENKTP